ncbi:ABC transporter permease [Pelagicoccus mobilis]|uniref:ABC transporter permease n=1 Tax=Pelagicoccus mobilis TaxID=415221 RepID=A0A934VP78_9BACT|nr:ABC transporter permease [Pelagicoccus mobilis]MBK1880701.1 ABC transporter permease [Pelagicoccus mobilis]
MKSRLLYRTIISLLLVSTLTCNLLMMAFLHRFFYGDLKVEEPATLHRLASSLGTWGNLAYADYRDVVVSTDAFESLSANLIERGIAAYSDGSPHWTNVSWTSGSFSEVIGRIELRAGRFLRLEDDDAGANKVAVVNVTLWESLGRGTEFQNGVQLFLKGQAFEVVGVVENAFPNLDSMEDVQIWAPLKQNPMAWQYEVEDYQEYQILARLDPERKAVAELQLDAALADIEERLGFSYTADVLSETEFRIKRRPNMHRLFVALFVVTGFLFVLGTVNQVLMLVTRSVAISADLKVMSALGARAKHVLLRFFKDFAITVAISLLGVAACSLAVVQLYNGFWGASYGQIPLERLVAPVPLFLLCGMVAFLVVLHTGFPFMTYWFRGESLLSRDRAGGSRFSMKNGLSLLGVVSQVALVTICILGCGAFLKSISDEGSVTSGPNEDRMLHVDIALSGMQMSGFEDVHRRLGQIEGGLQELGGIESVSASSTLPLNSGGWTRALVEGRPLESEPEWISFCFVVPGYFKTMGLEMLEGRDFLPEDASKYPPVNYIINRSYAEREFPGEQALGRRIAPWGGTGYGEVIAIVEDQPESVSGRVAPNIYVPAYQDRLFLHVLLEDEALVAGYSELVVDKIKQVDPDVIVVEVATIDSIWEEALASPRLGFMILLSLSLIGLVLSLCGVFGYQSYIVILREREFAVRHALGLEAKKLFRIETGRGLLITFVGFVAGVIGFFAGERVFRANLFDISLPMMTAALLTLGLFFAFAVVLIFATTPTLRPKLATLMRE